MSTSKSASVDPAWRRLRIPLAAALALAAVVAVVVVHYIHVGERYCHPERKHVTEADRASARKALPTIEDAVFRSDDGLTIRGFYLPPKNGVVVVMGHGLMENRMRFVRDAEMLARHGYGALFFDWRAHGESEGEVTTWGDREQRDLRAAIDFAAQRGGADVKIATLGFSVGSSAVALEATHDPRVRAVILEALWPSLEEEMDDKAHHAIGRWPTKLGMKRSGVDFANVRPIDHIAEIAPRPLLLLGGSIEHDTPVPVTQRVFDAAKAPKRLWIVPGADHGEYFKVQPVDYERTVMSFLDEVFFGG